MAVRPPLQAQRPPDLKEVHILWVTAGLSCDGDTVSITAATLPSIEDVVLGAIPGLPCGVHMYTGKGKLLEARHVPMFVAAGNSHG